jgi:methylated-DNA-[protein]-cysteine S-methyltransferase
MTTLSPTLLTTTVDSPIGPLTITAEGEALTGLHMHRQRHFPAIPVTAERDDAALAPIVEQLQAYFAGELIDFELPLHLRGTPFQQRVWAALQEIPYGETISYGELARWVGNHKASRAVGTANGRNPVAIVVPCHRVIAADGGIGGYGGGLDRKRWLLEHEAGHGLESGLQGRLEL